MTTIRNPNNKSKLLAMKTNNCPICNSDKPKTILCKTSFTYMSQFDLCECHDCDLIYFNPTPSQEQFINFYSVHDYSFDRWKQEAKGRNYAKRLNQHNTYGKILDVGCATGYLIEAISRFTKWEVYGVELSEKPANFARDVLKLKNIIHGDLFDANYPDNFFNFINIGDVLEHVPDPVSFLHECHRILKPDGVIILAVPNGYNDSRGLINHYHKYGEPGCHHSGHIFFFQKKTFSYMFNKTNFNISKVNTWGIKNGLRNLGLIPSKGVTCSPRTTAEKPIDSDIYLQTKKKYSDFYYQYRYNKRHWLSINGIHNFGLNLSFELRPKPR